MILSSQKVTHFQRQVPEPSTGQLPLRALPKQLQAPAKNIRQTIDSYSKQIAGLSSVKAKPEVEDSASRSKITPF